MNSIHLMQHLIHIVLHNIFLSILILLSSCIIMIFFLDKKSRKISNILSYREDLFNSLCSNVNDVFVIYDVVNKQYEYISPNFEKIFGISSAALIANHFVILENIEEDNKSKIITLFSSGIVNHNIDISLEYYHPVTLQKYWMVVHVYPVNSHGNIIRYIISIADETKENQSKTVLNEVLLNTQKTNEARKDFISHLSHELKTQINAINGMTQIASKSLNNIPKLENCLDKINHTSKDLVSLINNILDIIKVESNKINLSYSAFSISNTITTLSSLFSSHAELNNQTYSLIFHEIKNDTLLGDSLRLKQILANCLSNSFKFTPTGGKINLEVSQIEYENTRALYRFVISDTGKGMSKEFIDRIFNPFEQEDDTISQIYGGTGLGMSITKNLLTLMGGNIQVSSKIGIGTTITIDIVFDIPELTSEQVTKVEAVEQEKYDFTGKQVLVIEDNEINLEITCEFLKYINIKVDSTTNGYDAIKLFESSKIGYYDAILMDIHMPGLNGYETTKVIRNSLHPDAKKICIIAMTADNIADKKSCLDYGMNCYLTKPIDINQFNRLLYNVISKEQ